jgi:hypothetical protein
MSRPVPSPLVIAVRVYPDLQDAEDAPVNTQIPAAYRASMAAKAHFC